MHNQPNRLEEHNYNNIPFLGLAVIFFLILGILPVLPSQITQILRPAEIALFIVFPASFYYRLPASGKWMLLFMAYYLAVLVAHPITKSSFMAWASLELFSAFFLLVISRPWSKNQIQMLLIISAIASTIFSIIIFRDNPDFLHEKAYAGTKFMTTTINDNTAAFSIVPGALSGILLMFFYSPKGKRFFLWKKVVFIVCSGVCFFMLFCLGARSAFFSAMAGASLIVLEWTNKQTTGLKRSIARVAIILILVAVFFVGRDVTEGTHSARLFDVNNLTNGTGRDELADQAWRMIHKKPLFGGGFDYWALEDGDPLGTHNSFLTHLVQGGFVALLILLGFLVTAFFDLLRSGSLIPLAFMTEMVAHTATESDLNYYAFIPLIISFCMVNYARQHRCLVADILQTAPQR